jgi:hypothetical protein
MGIFDALDALSKVNYLFFIFTVCSLLRMPYGA